MLRRALTWMMEIAVSATLIAIWLRFYEGEPTSLRHPFLLQWWHYMQLTVVVFMLGSGYLLTTAICAMSRLRDQSICLYPAVVAALFAIHLLLFSGARASQSVMPIYVVGLAIVFVCALAGNMALRKQIRETV